MKRVALLLAVLGAFGSAAGQHSASELDEPPATPIELVAYEGNSVIQLTSAACTDHAVLSHIDPKVQEHFRTASATLQGHTYHASWGVLPGAALLIYEDGDQGLVPLRRLRIPVRV